MSSSVQPLHIQCLCEIGRGRRLRDEVLTRCLAAFLRAIIGIETSLITEDRCCCASRALILRWLFALERALLRLIISTHFNAERMSSVI